MYREPPPTKALVVIPGVQVNPHGCHQHPTTDPEDPPVLHCEVAPADPRGEDLDPIRDPQPVLCEPPPLLSSSTPTPPPPSHSIQGPLARRWPPCPPPPSSSTSSPPPRCELSPAGEGLVPESLPHRPNPPSSSSIIKTLILSLIFHLVGRYRNSTLERLMIGKMLGKEREEEAMEKEQGWERLITR